MSNFVEIKGLTPLEGWGLKSWGFPLEMRNRCAEGKEAQEEIAKMPILTPKILHSDAGRQLLRMLLVLLLVLVLVLCAVCLSLRMRFPLPLLSTRAHDAYPAYF